MTSAGYDFVRWFAAAAAPYLAPKIAEWSSIHIPFVIAAVAAVAGAVVVRVRRTALTHEAAELVPKHATEDGVTLFAN
jgi:MFS transporter, ACDE family, multidrug resistance protein